MRSKMKMKGKELFIFKTNIKDSCDFFYKFYGNKIRNIKTKIKIVFSTFTKFIVRMF